MCVRTINNILFTPNNAGPREDGGTLYLHIMIYKCGKYNCYVGWR